MHHDRNAALLLMGRQVALLNFGITREGLEDQLLGPVVAQAISDHLLTSVALLFMHRHNVGCADELWHHS
jgi:hypothetical protein